MVHGCAVSRRYINVCNCDMFSVVNLYLDHLKVCVVSIDDRGYVCCSGCNGVSNECHEPTSCLVQPISTHGGDVMYFGCVCFRGELGFLNFDNICSLSSSSLYLILFMLTCSMMRFLSLLLLCLCPCGVSVVMWSSLVCL